MATLAEVFTNIANAIRKKTGKTATMTPDTMATEIGKLSDTSSDTIAVDKMLSGITAHDKSGNQVTGSIPTKTESNLSVNGATVTAPAGYYATQVTKSVATATQATPSVSINSSGLITASATQAAGYVSAGTKTGTKQLTTQAAKTITPSTSSQTAVASGRYTTGAVTVAAIPSQYITTTDATAAAADIRSGKTAYVDGAKITGTMADFDGSYECSGDSTGGSGGGGSGTSSEVISATLSSVSPLGFESAVYYVGVDGSLQTATSDGEISIVKNSIIIVEQGGDDASVVGDATIFCNYYPDVSFFYVYGDITISG